LTGKNEIDESLATIQGFEVTVPNGGFDRIRHANVSA
jgi:hypothetical protein